MFNFLALGATVLGGISQKKAANSAAAAAQRVGNFNADLIERDVDLLEKQRTLINSNAVVQEQIDRFRFSESQGSVVTQYSGAGIDASVGTPLAVLRQNAREFEFDQAILDLNNSVTNQQINDQQENAELSAELSRMEGGASAAGLRAQGTSSLISSFGSAAKFGYTSGMFG